MDLSGISLDINKILHLFEYLNKQTYLKYLNLCKINDENIISKHFI